MSRVTSLAYAYTINEAGALEQKRLEVPVYEDDEANSDLIARYRRERAATRSALNRATATARVLQRKLRMSSSQQKLEAVIRAKK